MYLCNFSEVAGKTQIEAIEAFDSKLEHHLMSLVTFGLCPPSSRTSKNL